MGKILINACILQDPFLIRIISIRVNREVQDISLCTYLWSPSKKPCSSRQEPPLLPSASSRQSPITSSGLVVQQKVVGLRPKLSSIVKLTCSLSPMVLYGQD